MWLYYIIIQGQKRNEFHLVGLENSETTSMSLVWPSDQEYGSSAWPFHILV